MRRGSTLVVSGHFSVRVIFSMKVIFPTEVVFSTGETVEMRTLRRLFAFPCAACLLVHHIFLQGVSSGDSLSLGLTCGILAPRSIGSRSISRENLTLTPI